MINDLYLSTKNITHRRPSTISYHWHPHHPTSVSPSPISHHQSVINNQSSTISHQQSVISPNSPKRIWIINPFDQLPNESDVPLRYWALCRTLAALGHDVTWWSSDFSHLTKAKRQPCPDTDGFSVRLIPTDPYSKNISLARLKNHHQFAQRFKTQALQSIQSGELPPPDRIVVSLPPLGVAEAAFSIREYLQKAEGRSQKSDKNEGSADATRTASTQGNQSSNISHQTSVISHQTSQQSCEVIVDIMDAWPEVFQQVIPKPLRKCLGPILLAPLHRSATRAYQGADKISAVGQYYLNLATQYLGKRTEDGGQKPSIINHQSSVINHQSSVINHQPPLHLCYHGTDLSRFRRDKSEIVTSDSEQCDDILHSPLLTPHSSLQGKPLRAVYLGAMGSGYDLMTIVQVAARWKAENVFPFQIHFAGDGPQLEKLKAEASRLCLLSEDRRQGTEDGSQKPENRGQNTETGDRRSEDRKQRTEDSGQKAETGDRRSEDRNHLPSPINHQSSVISHQSSVINHQSSLINHQSSVITHHSSPPARIVFHGQLGRDSVNDLLLSADLALVTNRPGSLVACPYKAGEYAAAGLPMISCLDGELGNLLDQWSAGSKYKEGDVDSLHAAFKNYSNDWDLLKQQSLNTRKMAKALFDRESTYQALAEFITKT